MLVEGARLAAGARRGVRVGRAVLACGGTGGHVYPAIAIARELLREQPGVRVSFVGRPDSFESRIVAREGFELDALEVGRLAGQSVARRLSTLALLPMGVHRAATALARRRPDVVIGTGGFVSGPVMLAAVLRRLPTVVQEQNAVAGLTNRVLWPLVDRVALAHAPDRELGPRFRVTGNPVRQAFFDVPDHEPAEPFDVLVLGGSQGARRLNEAALAALGPLAEAGVPVRLTIQCGPRWEQTVREGARAARIPVAVEAFLHDVPERLARASLVICRAGASTVAELCAAGRPAVLVPFPHAAGDHQTANARALCRAGAAELVPDAEMTGERFAAVVGRLAAAPEELRERARRARGLARRDAARSIVQLAVEAIEARAPRRAAPGEGAP